MRDVCGQGGSPAAIRAACAEQLSRTARRAATITESADASGMDRGTILGSGQKGDSFHFERK